MFQRINYYKSVYEQLYKKREFKHMLNRIKPKPNIVTYPIAAMVNGGLHTDNKTVAKEAARISEEWHKDISTKYRYFTTKDNHGNLLHRERDKEERGQG